MDYPSIKEVTRLTSVLESGSSVSSTLKFSEYALLVFMKRKALISVPFYTDVSDLQYEETEEQTAELG